MLDSAAEYRALIHELTTLLRTEPRNATLLNNRGLAQFEIGQNRAALRDLKTAASLAPDEPVHHLNCATVLTKLKRIDESLVCLGLAVTAAPEDPYARRMRAHQLHTLGRFDEAVADYDVAIRVEPDSKQTIEDRKKAALRRPR